MLRIPPPRADGLNYFLSERFAFLTAFRRLLSDLFIAFRCLLAVFFANLFCFLAAFADWRAFCSMLIRCAAAGLGNETLKLRSTIQTASRRIRNFPLFPNGTSLYPSRRLADRKSSFSEALFRSAKTNGHPGAGGIGAKKPSSRSTFERDG